MKLKIFIVVITFIQITKADSYESAICQDIKKICETAGFIVGEVAIKNGVWANCYTPLKKGHSIRSIKLTDKVIEAIRSCEHFTKA